MGRQTSRSRRWAAVVLGLGLVAAACSDDSNGGVARLGEDEPGPSVDDVQVEPDPDAVVDIDYATLEGGQGNFTDFAGQPLVINFFAAWCAPCVSEMPEFEEVFQAHQGEIAFIGISEDQVADDSIELVGETGISYPTGWDPEGDVFGAFAALGMPTTVFVTANGEIAHQHTGALSEEALGELIDEHLA